MAITLKLIEFNPFWYDISCWRLQMNCHTRIDLLQKCHGTYIVSREPCEKIVGEHGQSKGNVGLTSKMISHR